MTRAVERDSLR